MSHGMTKRTSLIVWNEERDAFLRANYRTMGANRIAAELGTSKNSVCGRASRLGLSVSRGERASKRDMLTDRHLRGAEKKKAPLLSAVRTDRRRLSRAVPHPDTAFMAGVSFGEGVVALRFDQCRFIVSEKPYLFCEEAMVRGAYCASHASMCYTGYEYGKRS